MLFQLQDQSLVLAKRRKAMKKDKKPEITLALVTEKENADNCLLFFCSLDVVLECATCLVTTKTGPEIEKVNSQNQDSPANSSQLSLFFFLTKHVI